MWTWMVSMAFGAGLPELSWDVVNDGVMGGVSTGQVAAAETVTFRGALSLDNNGGFVSIRSRPQALNLDDVVALRVTVKGDGRTWDLTLRRSDVPIRAGSYRVALTAPPEGATIDVPLADFRPTSFGRPVGGAPALDAAPGRIDSVGFLLADGRPGPFALEVSAVEPVRGTTGRGRGHGEVIAALERAVAEGVPLFNAGDAAGCGRIYAAALAPLTDHGALTPGERSIVAGALQAAGPQSPTDAAWTLRRAIDTLLASGPQ